MEKDERVSIFESVEFLFRHPWLFLSAIAIIMNIVFAQLSFSKLVYESRGIVSFDTISDESEFSKKDVDRLTERIMVGAGVRHILKEVWPDLDEKKDQAKHESLREWLRGRGGVSKIYDEKANFLTLSLKSDDPFLCRKVVQAVINALIRENKKSARTKLAVNLDFLTNELEYYRDKIKGIDEELSKIKTDLKQKAETLSVREKILISEVTGEIEFSAREQVTLQKLAKYDEKLVELKLQLLESERTRSNLESRFAEDDDYGSYGKEFIDESVFANDPYVKAYTQKIASKKLEITNLELQGYLNAHPEMKKVESELMALEGLLKKRVDELKGKRSELGAYESMAEVSSSKAKIKGKLREADQHIGLIKDKIELLQNSYKAESQETFGEQTFKHDEIATSAARLKELREEKEISEKYYEEARKKMEEAQLKTRAEEAEAGVNISIIEEAKIPTKPIPFQKTQKIFFGFIVAIFVGAMLAYIVDSLDTSIKTPSELRKIFQVPVLGSIDSINTIREMRLKALQRKAIVIGWIVFALLSKPLVKLFFR